MPAECLQLAALGYRDRDIPVGLAPTPVGALDRDGAVDRVLARLAAARSAWNAADIRGEVEQLIAAAGIVVDAAIRSELAEDLTARAVSRCVPLLDRDGAPIVAPAHVRAWTSQPVLDVEADLTARLAVRGTDLGAGAPQQFELEFAAAVIAPRRLDVGQAAAAVALAGDRQLVVIEGAAGAGKTTTLAAATDLLEVSGHRQVIVTPTLKASKVAAAEVGTRAGSAAWLAFQHGWRWDDNGAWTRLTVGEPDPLTGRGYAGPTGAARLRPGDLLVVDEAGMRDQDTARALLTVADECQVRLALLGDRHQLAAVGRGGVLDLAVHQVEPGAHLTLDGVHRFTRPSDDGTGATVPDTGYADLTLAMRTGDDPGAVFGALLARGQIRLHPDPGALRESLAGIAAEHYREGGRLAVVVDTREQVVEINAAIRERLVAEGRVEDTWVIVTAAGRVEDTWVIVTAAGQRIGAGDRIATRRNDRDLSVANRDTWIVTAVSRRGAIVVTPTDPLPGAVPPPGIVPVVTPPALTRPGRGPRRVTPTGPEDRDRVLPADYVSRHVELAYASTAHGVQGDTVPTAHVVIGEHTGAASAYVGMARGRQENIAHLIATDPAEAREQWIAVFARDRADLGPAHAADLAAQEAARYAPPRPLEQVLDELHEARAVERSCLDRLTLAQWRRDALAALVAAGPSPAGRLPALEARHEQAFHDARQARERAAVSDATINADADADTDRVRGALLAEWEAQRAGAFTAAQTVHHGSGLLGFRRGAVTEAQQQLIGWSDSWRPHLPAMPTDPQIAHVAGRADDRPRLLAAFDQYARVSAERAHPEHAPLAAAAHSADTASEQAQRDLADGRRELADWHAQVGRVADTPDPAARLADVERTITATNDELTAVRALIAQLKAEPAFRAQPAEQHADEPGTRRIHPDAARSSRRPVTPPKAAPEPSIRRPRPEDLQRYAPKSGTSRGIGC